MEYERPSKTYKFKIEDSDHAIYFTIVDGDSCVEAMFVNSKEMKSFQWVTALMTSYSRQIKSGIPINNIINDMKNTFDPIGVYYSGGKKYHSIIQQLGMILEGHVNNEG